MPHYWSDQDDETPIRNAVVSFQKDKKKKFVPPPKKVASTATPAKPCVIYSKNDDIESAEFKIALRYNKDEKVLCVTFDPPEEFPSRAKARSAVWHTLENFKANDVKKLDGTPYHADDFLIEDV